MEFRMSFRIFDIFLLICIYIEGLVNVYVFLL